MQTHLFLLGILAVLSLCQACHRFEKRFDAVATLCGVDPASIQSSELFVKLETPQGEELSAEDLLTTRSRFLSGKRSQAAPISERGCIRVPAESGVIQAFSSVRGWSLAHNITQPSDRNFLRLPMQSSPQVSAELQCPAQGLYAHTELSFPLRWSSNGSLHPTLMEIVAEDESQQKTFVLFQKPYGIHLADLPSAIPTAQLPEGSYRLHLTFQVSTEGWDLPGSVANRVESCPLVVLHRRPEVGGVEGLPLGHRFAVIAQNESLPWKTPSPQSDLLYCRERRGGDVDEEGLADTLGACQPQGPCQELMNFQRTGAITASDPGVFDYYVYAEDKAGNRSSMSCQTFVVTERKPQIELLWSNAEWDKPRSQMRLPQAEVQLRIRGTHPQLEDASLRYQCKAEFVRMDQSVAEGSRVICTSGRCRNQSMGNFLPCDAEFGMSLVDLWSNIPADGGALRVTVKTDDGAGHSEEQQTSVGIQPSFWNPTPLHSSVGLDATSSQLLEDRKGRLFHIELDGDAWIYDEAKAAWDPLPLAAQGRASDVMFWLSAEKDIHAQWTADDTGTTIARWTDAGWQKLNLPEGRTPMKCMRPREFHQGGFWCQTENGLAIHQNEKWSSYSLKLADSGDICPNSSAQLLSRDASNHLWIACQENLYQLPSGSTSWTAIKHALPLVSLGVDRKGRLWTIRGTGRDDLLIQREEAGQTQTMPTPPTFNGLEINPKEFVIGPASELIFGDSYWDETAGAWQVLPAMKNRRPSLRVIPQFSSRGELFWETDQGLLRWDGQGLHVWDLTLYALDMPATGMQAVIGKDGTPWVLATVPGSSYASLYKFQRRNWVYYPQPKASARQGIGGLWVDDKGMPQVYIPTVGLYSLTTTGWNMIFRSPKVAEELPLETTPFEPVLLSPKGIYRWDPEQSWLRLVRFQQPTSYWGGTKDKQGRYWLYQDNMELGVIDGQEFRTVPLRDDAGSSIHGLFRREDSILVATNQGILSRAEGQTDWHLSLWKDWGLESMDRIRQLDADAYLVSVTDELQRIAQLWELNLKTQTKKSLAVPDEAYFLGGAYKTTQGDYFMAIKFDIYRTDGVNLTRIFSQEDLYSLAQGPGTFLQFRDLRVDADDNLWFHTGFGVVRIFL